MSRSSRCSRGGSIAACARRSTSSRSGSPARNCCRSPPLGVEQPGADDLGLAAPPLAQPAAPLGRIEIVGEEAPVARDRLVRRPVVDLLAGREEDRPLAQPLDRLRVVRDEQDRAALVLERRDDAEALALEVLVADREDLVEEQHVGLQERGDREPEPHRHPARVRADRPVDRVLDLGERDDLVEALADLGAAQALDRPVQVDVLAAAEVRVEAGAELEQRADAAVDLHGARRRLDDPGEHPQQRRLARAVAADQADGLAGRDLGRDVAQRPDVLAAGAPARDDEILERARLAGMDAEAARDAVGRDRAGRHAGTHRIGAALADERREPRQRVGVDGGEDAVAEVEDVPGPAPGAGEDVERLGLDDAPTARAARPDRGSPGPPGRAPGPSPCRAGSASRGRSRRRRPPPSPRAASRCRCRSGSSARRPPRGRAPSGARRARGSAPARARRPTSRRAGSRRRRRAPWRRRSRRTSRRASRAARARPRAARASGSS